MIVGTNHFRSTYAACQYYAEYGLSRDDVLEKIRTGEIVVWKKPETKPGEHVVLIDNGARYAIITKP